MIGKQNTKLFPESIAAARCMDCGKEFIGPIGIHFLEAPGEQGIEVVVIDQKRNVQHAIARVPTRELPHVEIGDDYVPEAPSIQ